MPNAQEVSKAIAAGSGGQLKASMSIGQMLDRADVKKKFEAMLGKRAAGFMSSIISLTNADKNLAVCDPRTIIAAAAMAATLDLPVNKSLGFAWVIPYKTKAEFQMGWKGYVQLGIRSGQYRTMNAAEIYEDEIKFWNPITGEIEFTPRETWKFRAEGQSEKIVGYVAFFKLINGFEKYLYMTTAQLEAHAKKYSQSYNYPGSKWKTDKHPMCLKTVLKLLLSKYGVLSIDMQRAVQADQGVIVDAGDKIAEPIVEFTDAVLSEEAVDPGTAQEPTQEEK
ncbi:MAG: recombinase RecT [Desulfurellales bacterium]|nr:MAG: recombinase RecT [Desulfurellales bacterium]